MRVAHANRVRGGHVITETDPRSRRLGVHELANFDVSRAVARQRAVTGTEIGSKTSCRELRPLSQGRAGVSKMHSPTRIVGAAVETWRAPVTHSHVANFHATPREIHSNDRGRNQRFRHPCSTL